MGSGTGVIFVLRLTCALRRSYERGGKEVVFADYIDAIRRGDIDAVRVRMDPQVIRRGVGKTDEELLSAGAAQEELAEGVPGG